MSTCVKRWERSRFHRAIYQRKRDFVAGKGREKLTKECIEDALRLCRAGMTDKDIAAYLGVAPETYSRWINHPRTDNQRQLCQAMKKAEVERKATLVTRVMEASNKSWQAAAWLLERKYPSEFAKPVRPVEDRSAERDDECIKGYIEALGLR